MSGLGEEKMLIARAKDTVDLCERQNCIKYLGFLTPVEAETIRRSLSTSRVKTVFFGGYPYSERTMLVALPDYLEEKDAEDVVSVVEITGRDIGELRHPDFLGSLLGLGIKREKIGDILTLEDRCIVFVDENIADYIVKNLGKVGRKGVKVRCIDKADALIPPPKVEKINVTVAGLRLDCIVAAAAKTSRSGALPLISEGRVFVNWSLEDSPSFKVKPGDVLSVRGVGRFRLGNETRDTKKGRIGICIEKMI